MGATGSGKSSFINLASNSALPVGYGLKSCTANVARSEMFELLGRPVTLIDTPGFDDTTISETDILNMIALYLSTTYEQGFKLSGIVYMHRISDFRVGGISRRNFSMFRKLCGDNALHNVVIVTNMWGEVTRERGVARERELATDDLLFGPALALGARMLRHNNTVSCARSILSPLLSNIPKALRIQEELVDERKDIADTDAGQELGREIAALLKKHRAELAEVQRELQAAVREKDMETKRELELVRRDLENQITRAEHDRQRLSREYEEGKRVADEKVRSVMDALEEERRCRAEREQEILQLVRSRDASAADRALWMRQLQELEEPEEDGFFSVVGKMLDVVLGVTAAFVTAQTMEPIYANIHPNTRKRHVNHARSDLPIYTYAPPPAHPDYPQWQNQPYWGGSTPFSDPRISSSARPQQYCGPPGTLNAQVSPEPDEIIIAVMGATGSGKSTFINLVSGSRLAVGQGLKSCTYKVETGQTFDLFDRSVTLVDTPGFDDTTVSDTDILKMIAVYLSTTYENGHKLSGVIYMHRISDFRVGGIAKRNFNMFRKLCGDDSLKNVVIVTNMWSEVSPERGAAREHELCTDEILFKPVIDKGAEMLRHDNTLQSAQAILWHLVNKRPRALRIQRELVDEGKDITQTAAGEELDRELVEMAKKHAQQLEEIQQEMAEALAAKDMETKKELEEVRQDLLKSMEKIENDRDRISREYEEQKSKADAKMREVEAALAAERQAGIERQNEIQTVMTRMDEDKRASAAERVQWEARILELQHKQRGGGFFGRVGRFLDSLF
ncbi:hypothetical protein NM688_g525 [Phlebia brevispora]|uniref:Uncharacterized protein n=1 Tax=Phlebia brevispora TaxID=194682 RepID=A0ACC1TDW0_9APHY|nr:hypothetical protein NM688_g525 [Phlebia brevispora]